MENELKSLGLTTGEIKIYLALLKIGEATNTPIAKETSLQNSTVFYCINSLLEKGFVSYIVRQNKKHYYAAEPENLQKILDEKEKEIINNKKNFNKIIPKLKELQKKEKNETKAEVYEGFNGFKNIFQEILADIDKNGEYKAFAITQELGEPEKIKFFFTNHNKELKRRNIKLKLLTPEWMRNTFEKMYGKKFLTTYQEIRYTKETIPTNITITKNKVITHIKDENDIKSFKITNKTHAKMYNDFFDELWERSKL